MLITSDKALEGTPTQRVLVIHPNNARRDTILQALSKESVTAIETVEDALRLLTQSAPDLVIASHTLARRLLKGLEALAPKATRLFLCAMSDVEGVKSLLELAAEGHLFSTLDDSIGRDEMERRLRQILSARASGRILPSDALRAVFEVDGAERHFEIADVSSDGLGLHVDADSDVSPFTPGADLIHLRIERDGMPILRADRAYLRHLRFDETTSTPFFHVGVAFPQRREPETGTLINDPMRVMGLLRRVVARRTPIRLKNPSDPSRTFELKDARLSPVGSYLILHGTADGCVLSAGDIVQVLFEVSGLSHSGLAPMAPFVPSKPGRVAVFVPTSVNVRHRRYRARFRVSPQHPFAISFVSPITGERLVRPVVDLQTNGLSFTYDAAREAFPVGLVLQDLQLTLPDGSSEKCWGTVRDSGPVSAGEPAGFSSPRRCGLSLADVSHHAKAAILDAFMAERSPKVKVGDEKAFSSVWDVVRSADGYYPDYPLEAGAHLDTLEETHRKIHDSGEGIGKTLLYHDQGEPVGHASGLRYYSKTWVLQHLAVRPTFTRDRFTGRDLSSLVVEYAEILEDVEWVRKIWNVKNRWVNRLGGWVARTMLTQGLCHLRTFNFMHRPIAPDERPAFPSGVIPGRREHLQWQERHWTRTGEALRLRTDDLSAKEFDLHTLGERLAPFGLHRRRHLVVAEGSRPMMAMIEESSEGMHWGEFTNAFSLVGGPRTPETVDARRRLANYCVAHYAERGRPSAVALVDDADVSVLEGAGFIQLGKFAEFTFHRSTIQNWIQLSSAIFERLQRAMEKTSIRDVEAPIRGPGLGAISGITPIPH